MAESKAVSEYLAKIGRRGGQARVKKGVAMLSPAAQSERARAAAAARWGTKKETPPAKVKASKKKASK